MGLDKRKRAALRESKMIEKRRKKRSDKQKIRKDMKKEVDKVLGN